MFLRTRTPTCARLWRRRGLSRRLVARRIQHASSSDADVVVLRIEHRVDTRRGGGRRTAGARNGQYAAVPCAASSWVAGRVGTNDNDHQRHQWALHDSPAKALNRLDHERPSSRGLLPHSRLRFVDGVVNWKLLGELSLRKANKWNGCWVLATGYWSAAPFALASNQQPTTSNQPRPTSLRSASRFR